ncbi:hypothetical protein FXO38_19648 [Capsicum annuum]|nr:hypothetical protein FXO38_19648 [Capsicum annuum]
MTIFTFGSSEVLDNFLDNDCISHNLSVLQKSGLVWPNDFAYKWMKSTSNKFIDDLIGGITKANRFTDAVLGEILEDLSFGGKAPAKRRRVIEVIFRDELPKCSYSNIIPTVEELEQLDLPTTRFASYYPGTSSMLSSIGCDITGGSTNEVMKVFEDWIKEGLYKQNMNKKDKDDHYKVKCANLEFRQLDFVVVFPKSKNWFYLMYQQNKCWNDEHFDIILYYLRKKYKNKNFSINRYITIDCFFKAYIDKAYVNYYNADIGKELATQGAFARTDDVAQIEIPLINTIKGLSTPAVVFAKYLSEELGIPSSGIDAQYHHLRYASLLCKYRSEKVENGYFSDNDDPPRPKSMFSTKEKDHVLHIQ